ncbi:unnamed protein product [Sympodiomycopsis kandeliae]
MMSTGGLRVYRPPNRVHSHRSCTRHVSYLIRCSTKLQSISLTTPFLHHDSSLPDRLFPSLHQNLTQADKTLALARKTDELRGAIGRDRMDGELGGIGDALQNKGNVIRGLMEQKESHIKKRQQKAESHEQKEKAEPFW